MRLRFLTIIKQIICIVLLAMASALLFNQLIALFNIRSLSPAYERVVNNQQELDFNLRLLRSALLVPVFEELIFRAGIYRLTRDTLEKLTRRDMRLVSTVISAVCFGMYHGNLVQFIYAFLMSLIICSVYEEFWGFLAAVLFHAAANLFVLLLGSAIFLNSLCWQLMSIALGSFIIIVFYNRKEMYSFSKQSEDKG